jgi:hypothetical protein
LLKKIKKNKLLLPTHLKVKKQKPILKKKIKENPLFNSLKKRKHMSYKKLKFPKDTLFMSKVIRQHGLSRSYFFKLFNILAKLDFSFFYKTKKHKRSRFKDTGSLFKKASNIRRQMRI